MNPPRVYTCSPFWTPSHLPLHTIPLGRPSAPAPSILYPASNLDWRFVSQTILYKFQWHSLKSSRPHPLPQNPRLFYPSVSLAALHTGLFTHSKCDSFHLCQTLLYRNLTFLEKIQNLVAEAPWNFINKRVLLRVLGFSQKSTLIWKQDDLWKSYQALHEINIPNLRVKITPWFFSKNLESGNIATSYIWKILVNCYSQSDISLHYKWLPRWLTGKDLPVSAGDPWDVCSTPGLQRSFGGGNGKSLQYSSLGNSMDRGAWRATTYGIAKSRTRLSTHTLPGTPEHKWLQSLFPPSETQESNIPRKLPARPRLGHALTVNLYWKGVEVLNLASETGISISHTQWEREHSAVEISRGERMFGVKKKKKKNSN